MKRSRSALAIGLVLTLLFTFSPISAFTEAVVPSDTPEPAATALPTPTPVVAEIVPAAIAVPEATAAPEPTVAPSATDEPAALETPTPEPAETTPEPTAEATETAVQTPTLAPAETAMPTPTLAPVETAMPTPTPAPAETVEPSPSAQPTSTPAPTETAVPTDTPTPELTATPGATVTAEPVYDDRSVAENPSFTGGYAAALRETDVLTDSGASDVLCVLRADAVVYAAAYTPGAATVRILLVMNGAPAAGIVSAANIRPLSSAETDEYLRKATVAVSDVCTLAETAWTAVETAAPEPAPTPEATVTPESTDVSETAAPEGTSTPEATATAESTDGMETVTPEPAEATLSPDVTVTPESTDVPETATPEPEASDEAAGFTSLDELNRAYYPETVEYDGEAGVVTHGKLVSQLERLLAVAPTEPLSVAYVVLDEAYLYVGETSTFTITAEGGLTPYRYTVALYWQSYSATDNWYTRISYQQNATSNLYSYLLTSAYEGRFFLQITVTDSNGEYLIFRANYCSARRENLTDATTVAGKVAWIINQEIESGMSDYQKALALHDWLIYNANYDYTYQEYEAEGMLLRGTGVCQSYALAYQMLLTEVGISNLYVTGTVGGVGHAWNLVRLGGDWYHVDCTWDDPNQGGWERHTYFGLTDALISTNRTWGADDDRDYPSYIPDCTATLYNYTYISQGVSLLQSLTLNQTVLNLSAGSQYDLSVVASPATCRMHALQWRSSNPAVATVTASGTVTAVAEGTAVITCAESNGAHPAQCGVTVPSAIMRMQSPTYPGNIPGGTQVTTTVDVSGGAGSYAYNWYLFRAVDSYAVIPLQNVGVFDNIWTFTVPDMEGVYCIRVITTDGTTVAYRDCDWFYVYPAPFTVNAPSYPGNIPSGTRITTAVSVSGGDSTRCYAYNFYLFNSLGQVSRQNLGMFDNSWTFTVPDSGIYCIRVIATDGTHVDYADCDWFYVY